MPEVKKPQDHKPELFSFEHDGETYTFAKSLAPARKFGWQRKHRHLSDDEKVFVIFEAFAGEDAMAALDDIDVTSPEFKALMEAFSEEFGGSLGE